MWGSFFSGGKDPLKDLGYEILPDSQQITSTRSIWTLLNGKKKVNYFNYHDLYLKGFFFFL